MHMDELIEAISRNDPVHFLTAYLTLILNGCSLTLPQSIEPESALNQWKNVLPSQCNHATNDFIKALTALWVDVVTQQGANIHDNFIKECLEIMLRRSNVENRPLHPVEDNPGAALTGMDEKLQQVTPSISSFYEKDKAARKEKWPSKEVCIQKVNTAIKNKQGYHFLLYYLVYSTYQEKPQIPQSSVYELAIKKWTLIFERRLQKKVSTDFINQVSSLWINLVLKKGIPNKKEVLKEMVIHLKATKSDNKKAIETAPQKPLQKKKLGFVNTLIKIFSQK